MLQMGDEREIAQRSPVARQAGVVFAGESVIFHTNRDGTGSDGLVAFGVQP